MEKGRIRKSGLVTVQFHPQETFIQSWNVNDRDLIESKHIDKIHDINEDWETLKKAIDGLNPKPARNVTVMLITDEWSNSKTSREIEEIASKLQHRLNHPVEIVDADEMAAVTTWESIGADLPEKDQFKWVKRSRVVCLGVYEDHTGIALVESGRIIGGLSLPQESYPWHNIMLQNLEKNGIGFHRYLIRKAIDDFIKPMYSPDVTVVYVDDPTVRFGYKNDDPTVHVIGEGDEEDERKDAGYGALLHWIKEQIGWRAFFIDDAIKDEEDSQDLVSLTIGGDEEDDPDLVAQIHDMMKNITPDDEFFIDDAIKDEEDSQDLVSLTIGGDEEDDPDLVAQIHDMMKNITPDDDEFAIKDDLIVIPSPESTSEDLNPDAPTNGSDETSSDDGQADAPSDLEDEDPINEIISTGYETDDRTTNNTKPSKAHSNETEPIRNPFVAYSKHGNGNEPKTDGSEPVMVDSVETPPEVDKIDNPDSNPGNGVIPSDPSDADTTEQDVTGNEDKEQDVTDNNDDTTYDELEIEVVEDEDERIDSSGME